MFTFDTSNVKDLEDSFSVATMLKTLNSNVSRQKILFKRAGNDQPQKRWKLTLGCFYEIDL